MIHRPAPSQPRRTGRGILRIHRPLTVVGGLAMLLAAAIGLAPAASATLPPPEPSVAPAPPPPPPVTATAHFPMWAVVAIVAGTIVLSVATTLITLSLEHMRRGRHAPAIDAGPQAGAPAPFTTPEEARQGEVLSRHHYSPDLDTYRASGD